MDLEPKITDYPGGWANQDPSARPSSLLVVRMVVGGWVLKIYPPVTDGGGG